MAPLVEVIGSGKTVGWLVKRAGQYPRALQKVIERSLAKMEEAGLEDVEALPDTGNE